MDWGLIRKRGKQRFVLLYSLILSIPFVFDYLILKFLLNSFRLEVTIIELLIVWIICLSLSMVFTLFGWMKMERDWQKTN